MVQNAKDYNAPKSEVYEDSERVRKLVYNFMKVHNPEYEQNPGYAAFPTPIPQANGAPVMNGAHDGDQAMENTSASIEAAEQSSEHVTAPKVSEAPSASKASMAPSGTSGDGDGDVGEDDTAIGGDLDFNGMSFQDAQQNIIAHLIHYQDAE